MNTYYDNSNYPNYYSYYNYTYYTRVYKTGDLCRYLIDGNLEYLGRIDHQVKIRGYRIELPEIERAMETHCAVREAIVIVKVGANGSDPQLVGCFTLDSPMADALADLRCNLADRLPAHMIPGTFEEFPTFPLSPNGKVDRRALAELVRERHNRLTRPPANFSIGLEDQIHDAWCQVLDRAQAGLDDNFFDLGGDSLRLARLHPHLETLLNRKFPITELFAHVTIRGMAQHLSCTPGSDGKQQLVRDRARLQREAQAARRQTRS